MKRLQPAQMYILLVIALLTGSACWPFDDDQLSEMTLEKISGNVRVVRAGDVLSVDSAIDLQPGDIVQTARGSSAALRLLGEREAGMLASAEVTIVDTRTLESHRGAILADAGESMRVRFGEVEASSSNGLFRVDQRFASARAAAYRGAVELTAPGQSDLVVHSLHQASISANDLPAEGSPYDLDEGDRWDREHLGALVELEGQLDDYAAGLASQLGRQRPTLPYFRTLADGANVSFIRNYLRRSTPDLLIAFSVAENAELPLRRAFNKAFDIYDDFEADSHWSVVAGILDVLPKPLLAQVESIISSTQVVTAAGTGGDATAAFTLAAAENADSIDAPGSPREPGDPNPQPSEKPKPKESPTPPQGEECQSTIECAVNDVTDPSPTPTPSDPPPGMFDGSP